MPVRREGHLVELAETHPHVFDDAAEGAYESCIRGVGALASVDERAADEVRD